MEALSPNWNGSDEQKAVLREGLGLTPPGKDVWAPLGEATLLLHPEDRVRLLVDLVPLFEGTEDQRQALLEMKDVLPQVSFFLLVGEKDWGYSGTVLLVVLKFFGAGGSRLLFFFKLLSDLAVGLRGRVVAVRCVAL